MSTPTIEVRGLGKTYPGGVEAVKGIDFDVAPGEVFGLLGPNGAGKSTTIGMLTTTVRPTSGSARLAGHDVATEPLDGWIVVVSIPIVVDLPAPFGPRRPNTSPAVTSKLMPRTASTPPG